MTKIDEKTLDVMTLSLKEWLDLGHKKGRYKNPKTGTYTMVPVRVCPHCHEQIPIRMIPADKWGTKWEPPRDWEKNYVCPKCGKIVGDILPSRPGR